MRRWSGTEAEFHRRKFAMIARYDVLVIGGRLVDRRWVRRGLARRFMSVSWAGIPDASNCLLVWRHRRAG